LTSRSYKFHIISRALVDSDVGGPGAPPPINQK